MESISLLMEYLRGNHEEAKGTKGYWGMGIWDADFWDLFGFSRMI